MTGNVPQTDGEMDTRFEAHTMAEEEEEAENNTEQDFSSKVLHSLGPFPTWNHFK